MVDHTADCAHPDYHNRGDCGTDCDVLLLCGITCCIDRLSLLASVLLLPKREGEREL